MSEEIGGNQISSPSPAGGVIGTLTRIGNNGARLKSWAPGQSGNPSGRNLLVYAQVRKLAASVSVEAIERLIDLMRNGRDERVVYMAVMALLERGVGKVKDHSADDQQLSRIDLTKLSLADQELMAGMLRRILGMTDAPKEAPK